jgi:hypothetical protein
MELINSWRSEVKQWGKHNIKIRIGRVTLFDLYIDTDKRRFGITVMNIGVKNNTQRNGKVSNPRSPLR